MYCNTLFTVSLHFMPAQVFIVTNAAKFKHYERWATASDFPVSNLINDGTTSFESRQDRSK